MTAMQNKIERRTSKTNRLKAPVGENSYKGPNRLKREKLQRFKINCKRCKTISERDADKFITVSRKMIPKQGKVDKVKVDYED